MSSRGGPSTLAYLAKQAQNRAKAALALKITPIPSGAPLIPNQPPQPAKTQGISADEEMLRAVREFLGKFSG
jgi:hypothetical protein